MFHWTLQAPKRGTYNDTSNAFKVTAAGEKSATDRETEKIRKKKDNLHSETRQTKMLNKNK